MESANETRSDDLPTLPSGEATRGGLREEGVEVSPLRELWTIAWPTVLTMTS